MERVFEDRFAAGALRFGDHRSQLGDEGEGVAFFDQALRVGERVLEPRGIDLRAGGAHDLWMRRWADGFTLVPKHFVHLLAGARTREDDRDVVLVAAREPNHLLRKV